MLQWPIVGVWPSLVGHLHGVQGVAGSNPATPTIPLLPLCSPPVKLSANGVISGWYDLKSDPWYDFVRECVWEAM